MDMGFSNPCSEVVGGLGFRFGFLTSFQIRLDIPIPVLLGAGTRKTHPITTSTRLRRAN